MRYHHINTNGELMTGTYISTPKTAEDGRLMFTEAWQWLSGEQLNGYSEIIEIINVSEEQT